LTVRRPSGRDALLVMSHIDVVPVDAATESLWEAGPFSGDVVNGFLYGRGTIDDKIGVVSVMHSVEHLLSIGFKPKHTILMAFGHDEEIGVSVARLLAH
jgi:carboxypeptidase PM20D1